MPSKTSCIPSQSPSCRSLNWLKYQKNQYWTASPGAPLLAGDVGVGDRRRPAFALQLGEVPRVHAGVAERVARQVEMEPFAEPGDVGARSAPRLTTVSSPLASASVSVTSGLPSTVSTVVGSYCSPPVSQGVPFAQHQARRVGVDQALGGRLPPEPPSPPPPAALAAPGAARQSSAIVAQPIARHARGIAAQRTSRTRSGSSRRQTPIMYGDARRTSGQDAGRR